MFKYPETSIGHMVRDGGLSDSGQKPYDSGSCEYSADLTALVEGCRGRNGSFRLERANIVMQREEGAIPFVHYLDGKNGDDNGNAYEIRSRTHTVDGCKVFDYSIMKAKGSAALDFFVGALAEAMAFWDAVDVHAQHPREPIDGKINSFR